MDALTPIPAVAPPAAPAVAPAPRARRAPDDADHHPAPAPAHDPAEQLPALPLGVQRSSLEPPPPRLMTREEMAAILSLTT